MKGRGVTPRSLHWGEWRPCYLCNYTERPWSFSHFLSPSVSLSLAPVFFSFFILDKCCRRNPGDKSELTALDVSDEEISLVSFFLRLILSTIRSNVSYGILWGVSLRRLLCHSCSFLLSLPLLLLSTLIAWFSTALWPNRLTTPQNLKKRKWIKEISFPVYIPFISHCQQLMLDQSFHYESYSTLSVWHKCFKVPWQILQNEEIMSGAHGLLSHSRGLVLQSLTGSLNGRATFPADEQELCQIRWQLISFVRSRASLR